MSPALSLQQHQWCKLICGASFHHGPAIQNLALIYSLAGIDCIDVAADPAIVTAAQAGIALAHTLQPDLIPPWLMCSLNAGEDPHFRKAVLTGGCPTTCPQPCISICPPQAITQVASGQETLGAAVTIQNSLCYGCGRCQPICPEQSLNMTSYPVAAATVVPEVLALGIQALEIHTRVGDLSSFISLWEDITDGIPQLSLLSISLGDGEGLFEYLQALMAIMHPRPPYLVWQTDGRPMSGDLGIGATRATVNLAAKVLSLNLPGYVQMAGGTNNHSVTKAHEAGIPIAGVAYGSFARQLVATAAEMPDLPDHPQVLWKSVALARTLVNQIKSPDQKSLR